MKSFNNEKEVINAKQFCKMFVYELFQIQQAVKEAATGIYF